MIYFVIIAYWHQNVLGIRSAWNCIVGRMAVCKYFYEWIESLRTLTDSLSTTTSKP